MLTRKIQQLSLLGAALSLLVLTGCETTGAYNSDLNRGDNYSFYEVQNGYRSTGGHYRPSRASVPPSYHFTGQASPKKHQQRDADWVNQQRGYTIELATDENPAEVAKVLHNTPKNERMAQIKRKKNNKTVYTGVYGSYPSREAAESALGQLPANVRGNANVAPIDNVKQETRSRSTPPARSNARSVPSANTQRYDPLQGLDGL